MASFIMAGRMQAAIFVIASTLISLLLPPMIVFSNAAIALITLRKGWQQGVAFTLLATLTLVLISVILQQSAGSGVIAGLINWLPMVLLASALAMTKSWGKTLLLILAFSAIGVLLFHLIHPDASAYWKPMLEQMKPFLLKMQQANQTSGNIGKSLDETINNAANWMTGTFAAALAIISILSLIIARNWQARLYNPGGFGEEFRQIRIGKQASIALVVAIVIAVLSGNQLIVELIMVGIAIFLFQGLSLAHAMVKKRGMNTRWLIGLYILMFLLPIEMIVLLATFGIIDNFADFRAKIKA
ncbi:MAG TPA: DUF2232 domain-containing protein [Leucothrix sp.]|nr:DUF2232 domain-containing protein [Leucothrix sp.]